MKPKNESHMQLKPLPDRALALAVLLGTVFALGVLPAPSRADAGDIQQKIADTTAQIAQLEKEIAQYESDLALIGTQKKTLQSQINQLDVSRQKIAKDIAATQAAVTKTNLQLTELDGEITDKQKRIEDNEAAIETSLRSERKADDATVAENMLGASNFADAWEDVSRLTALSDTLRANITDLAATKESLTQDYAATQAHQKELTALKQQLSGQKSVLDQNRQEQSTLLTQTKNKESSFQALLAEKQQAKLDFEKQLSDYEATLHYTLDPTSIPKAGSGVLSFPLDPAYMTRCQNQKSIYKNIYCITQYFGNTAFAQSGAYNGKGHNGIDLGAPEGTKVVAALSGTVLGTGNTDLSHDSKGSQCYSYGKWVYVQHDNGLGTIYGHLSVISVSKGDRVSTGQLLGYSGQTGYATGPHLHFGLYVASQVKIIQLGDTQSASGKTPCANAFMPVAPTQAYLNPISYL